MAKSHQLNFTVDAEEADRLELSLDVIAACYARPVARGLGWLRPRGAGLPEARAGAVIDWIADAAEALDRRLMVRLVKGAYWDTEVKRAQERGLADYPVFTRKAMTDLCYLDCARKLLALRGRGSIRNSPPTMRSPSRRVIEDAGGVKAATNSSACTAWATRSMSSLLADNPALPVPRLCAGRRPSRSARLSGAAAAGERRQLVVRVGRGRSEGADRRHPQAAAGRWIADPSHARHAKIPLPRDLLRRRSGAIRPASNSATAQALAALLAEIAAAPRDGRRRAVHRRRRAAGARRAGVCRRSTAKPIGTVQRSATRRSPPRHGRRPRRPALPALDAATPARDARRSSDARRRSDRAEARPPDRAAAERGRQDARRCGRRSARGGRLLPLLCRRRRGARWPARNCRARPARATELRYRGRGVFVCITPVEFSAGDLPRPGRGRARRRQQRWWPSRPSRRR